MSSAALAPQEPVVSRERSLESHAFEAAWRAARGDALLPEFERLPLRHFKSMLSKIILMEFRHKEPAFSRIRIVGEDIRARVQRDMIGKCHFDFMPEMRRLEAANNLRHVATRPCGLWQIIAAHYERGYAHCHEITTLPLSYSEDATMLMLMIVPCAGQIFQLPKNVAVLSIDAPRETKFFDIGAGAPD